MVYFSNPQTWIVVAVTLIIVTLCIGLHYEILVHCRRYLNQLTDRRRRRVLVLILLILLAHSLEIWLFGIGYALLLEVFDGGELAGAVMNSYVDYVYYSAVVFTTVGFGDITPHGPIRFLTGMEALAGLVMITWSASYTFLEMQRDWTRE
ncbi:MAG TPA: potassium channel family protein [Gammaproteobacteria bacterium]|nr:potassium channel family protein [Gammaproteobacteria bacterium]